MDGYCLAVILGHCGLLVLVIPWLASATVRYRVRCMIAQDEDSHTIWYLIFLLGLYALYVTIENIRGQRFFAIHDASLIFYSIGLGGIGLYTTWRVMRFKHSVRPMIGPPEDDTKVNAPRGSKLGVKAHVN